MYSNNVIREDDTGYVVRSVHRSGCFMLPATVINYTSLQFEQTLVNINEVNLWTFRECLPLGFPLLSALYRKILLCWKMPVVTEHDRAKADVKFILINGKCLTRKRKWKPNYLVKSDPATYLFLGSCDFSLLFFAEETSYHKVKPECGQML
jgi:hypothetical protein